MDLLIEETAKHLNGYYRSNCSLQMKQILSNDEEAEFRRKRANTEFQEK